MLNRKLFLREFIHNVGAINLGFEGCRFTWDNGHQGTTFIRECLDRALASKDWVMYFHQAKVTHLLKKTSDHNPIILNTVAQEFRVKRPFQFLNVWIEDISSYNVVEKAWKGRVMGGWEFQKTMNKLSRTARDLQRWNKLHFGDIYEKIKMLENQLTQYQAMLFPEKRKETEMLRQLMVLHLQQEKIWK